MGKPSFPYSQDDILQRIEPLYNTYAVRLFLWRVACGLKQKEAAELFNVVPTSMQNWEYGRMAPLDKVMAVLSRQTDALRFHNAQQMFINISLSYPTDKGSHTVTHRAAGKTAAHVLPFNSASEYITFLVRSLEWSDSVAAARCLYAAGSVGNTIHLDNK